MSTNESYDLAVEYVRERLRTELDGVVSDAGDSVVIKGLEQCDCIPNSVADLSGVVWDLIGVTNRYTHLSATYEAR